MLVECAFTILNLRLLLNPVMKLSVLAAVMLWLQCEQEVGQ